MNLKGYFKELQRRHVVKAGIAYLVVAWLLIQVLSILFPVFKTPDWVMQLSVIVLAIGFPIWLILAWVYDFSWGSIQKTEDVPFDAEVSRKKNVGLNRVIIGGLAIAVILLVVNTLRLSSKVDKIEGQYLSMEFTNSLAILPFEDLSPKKDQRYFSDGLARSIYDRLASYKDLKLISPTSSFQYRNKDVSIEVIAGELGVRYILEGNVQLFDKRYRASINLVDTKDGTTIWSKIFDDTLEDVLDTYDEVAQNVGQYLNVTIANADVRNRKVDPEAYLLCLRATDTLQSNSYKKEYALVADSLIRESIRLDPTYALSHAILSMTTLHKGLYGGEYSYDQALAIGLRAARKAVELEPEDFYGYNWLSNWQWHSKNAKASNEALNMAWKLVPNSADVIYYAAFQARRQNRLKDCLNYSERSVALDPKNPEPYYEIVTSNYMLGDFERAEWALRQSYEHKHEDVYFYGDLGYLYFLKGDFEKALEYSGKCEIEHSRYYNQSLMFYSKGDLIQADSTLTLLRGLPNDENYDLNTDFYLSMVYAFRGENDLAFEHLDRSEDYIKVYLEFFFTVPEFKNLYDDPRWDSFIDNLSQEFNYDFKHKM